MKSRLALLLKLFCTFVKFGCFTFGGGWSIVAQMQEKFVQEQGQLTDEELLDLTSVARSVPGQMVSNVAMLYGYSVCGYPGGVVCVLGLSFMPFLILAGITYCYALLQNNPWVVAAMSGVRAAVAPICLSAVISLMDSAYKFPPCVLMSALAFVLYFFLDLNCIWIVVLGMVFGLLISEIYERRAEK